MSTLSRYLCYASLSAWLALFSIQPVCGAESLEWNTTKSVVTADINSWTLPHLLQQISAQTGWHVYLEPGVTHPVSARFKNLSAGDALRSLIGDLNFALVPATNGVSQLFVFKTGQQNATQLISPVGTESRRKDIKHVPNELIVTLKPGENIEDLARLVGAKVTGKIDGINAYRLQFPDEASAEAALLTLGSNPAVKSIDYNYIVDAPPKPQTVVSTTVPPVQMKLSPPPADGRVVVGLIDTAIQPMGDLDQFIIKKLSVAGDAVLDSSVPSHATSMAQSILGAAAVASSGSSSLGIISVNVYGNNATTPIFEVASGIIVAVNNGANIINLSLGSEGDCQFLHNLIQQVTGAGVVVYAAAGNNSSSAPFYPAAYPEVIAVTAGNQGKLASYANYGAYVSLIAPGSAVVYLNSSAFLVSGTSTATANISGITAGTATSQNLSPISAANLVRTSPTFRFNGK